MFLLGGVDEPLSTRASGASPPASPESENILINNGPFFGSRLPVKSRISLSTDFVVRTKSRMGEEDRVASTNAHRINVNPPQYVDARTVLKSASGLGFGCCVCRTKRMHALTDSLARSLASSSFP